MATLADLAFLVSVANHPNVAPFLAPGSLDEQAIATVLEHTSTGEAAHELMLIESAAGQPLGGLELALLSNWSRICELRRLMLIPAARGSGIGSAAVLLACRHAFEDRGHHRVQAEVYADNQPAQRLFDHVGFAREGVRRRAHWRSGQWVDSILFGLLSPELPMRPPAAQAWSAA